MLNKVSFFMLLFAAWILGLPLVNGQEDPDFFQILRLPEKDFLPLALDIERSTTTSGVPVYTLNLSSRAFHAEAPIRLKGWRARELSNNQVQIYNILRPEASVTFSLFESVTFKQIRRDFEDWEAAYLEGFILDRIYAEPVSPKDSFLEAGKLPGYIFGKIPDAVIDYSKKHLATGDLYLCRDHFIDFRISKSRRYTLLVQFERPEDFGASAFADIVRALHSVRYVVQEQ